MRNLCLRNSDLVNFFKDIIAYKKVCSISRAEDSNTCDSIEIMHWKC